MNILNRIFGRRGGGRASSLDLEERGLRSTGGTFSFGGLSEAGVDVNADTALGISAVLACVRVVTDAITSLPCHILGPDGGRAADHPLADVLAYEANDYMSAQTWREATLVSLLLTGNAYSYIERGPDQRPTGLYPLAPSNTRPVRRNGTLTYQTIVNDRAAALSPADVFHVMFLTADGVQGISPISTLRNGLGLAVAAEAYAGRFFKNGGNVGSLLKLPPMSEAAIKTFADQWRKNYAGPDNQHRTAVFPDGYDFRQVGHSPEAGQMIDVRKFQVHEVARAYRVPLAIIDQTANASFASIESQERQLYEQAVRPLVTKIEAEAERKLLLGRERGTRVKFNMDARMRATTRERYAAHAQGITAGFLTVGEARELEGLKPLPGTDQLLRPLNMGTAPAGGAKDDGDNDAATPAARQIVADAARRIATKLTKAYERAARKGNVAAWAGDFLARHEQHVGEVVAAPIAAAGLAVDPAAFAARHVGHLRHQIETTAPDALLESWDDLADQIADDLLKGPPQP